MGVGDDAFDGGKVGGGVESGANEEVLKGGKGFVSRGTERRGRGRGEELPRRSCLSARDRKGSKGFASRDRRFAGVGRLGTGEGRQLRVEYEEEMRRTSSP